MLEDIFREQAAALRRRFADHDTSDFMRRLAIRIAEDAAEPGRVRHEPQAEPTHHSTAPQPPARAATLTQVAAPAQTPPARTTRPYASIRTRPRRPRRRPTPIITADPSAAPSAVIAHVRHVCEVVLRSDDIERLADFAADYDQTGARTFACLLYTLNRRDAALYWWRFAAGAGDPLAAHLLAAHHAAVGHGTDARVWRAIARMMGFTADRHLPHPVRPKPQLTEKFVYSVPWDQELRAFLNSPRLPRPLAAR